MMDYSNALTYLDSLKAHGINLRLTHARKLLEAWGSPHEKMSFVHVAGTNGKGSVCAHAASILREAGYRTGLYTSPEFLDFTDRIRVNGRRVSESELTKLVNELKPLLEEVSANPSLNPPTYFEAVTALALKHFEREEVDYAVLEVGLGGRLDATNVVTPEVSVITNVGLDHQRYLGNTLEEIAREKAGIIKKSAPLVTAEENPGTLKILERACSRKKSQILRVGSDAATKNITLSEKGGVFDYVGLKARYAKLKTRLLGRHQVTNAATAVAAVEELEARGVGVGEHAVREGLARTRWPGRLEVASHHPKVILDCAHNPAGMKVLFDSLEEVFGAKKTVMALGVSAHKDLKAICEAAVPRVDYTIATQAQHPLAAPAEDVEAAASTLTRNLNLKKSVKEALAFARAKAGPGDLVVAAGSIYVAAEAAREVASGS